MNQTYKHAALSKLALLIALLFLAVWILNGQDAVNRKGPTVEIYTEHGVVTESRAEIWTRLREENKPWTEPTPLPGNKDRKPKRERHVSKSERMLARQ